MLSALIAIGSAAIKGAAAKKAANTQAAAGRESLEFQKEKYEAGFNALQPFQEAGVSGLDAYKFELGLGDKPEGYGGFKESESFGNMLTLGRDQIEAGASRSGKLFSGATGTALEKFRTSLASNEVNNWLNRLGGLSSMGAQAASSQAGVGSQFAQLGAGTIEGIGNVTAACHIGAGDAMTGGFDTGLGACGYLTE